MAAIAVIYAVRPKPGQREEIRALFKRHIPTLRHADLITERPPLLLWSVKDEVFVESFEWKSVEHSRRAESIPAILEIWAEFALLAEFVPLAMLSETQNAFAHFEPL
jgi:hypothetical protein